MSVCYSVETDDFLDFGFHQAKEPRFSELLIRPTFLGYVFKFVAPLAEEFLALGILSEN